jgi:peptidoglycan hydrolase CwlO-like protein
MTISTELLVTIVLAILGAFWVLIRIIRHLESRKIEELAGDLSDARQSYLSAHKSFSDTDKQVEVIKNQISNLEKENNSLRTEVSELRKKHDEVKDELADMRETIAGFGACYITRKEILRDRDRED